MYTFIHVIAFFDTYVYKHIYRSSHSTEQAVPAQGGPSLHPPGQVCPAGPGHLHHQHRGQRPSGDSSCCVRDFLIENILQIKMQFIVFLFPVFFLIKDACIMIIVI